jgi:hypothetical protein
MDSERFDAWTRGLTSRRVVLWSLVVGFGLAGLLGPAAINAKRKKKRKRKRKKQAQPTPPPTCTDGIQNGDETGVDCGGSCPRCANGTGCANRNDCLSGVCLDGMCQPCTNTDQCGLDPNGPCACEQTFAGSSVCNPSATPVAAPSCAACPVDTNCFAAFAGFSCIRACQAP